MREQKNKNHHQKAFATNCKQLSWSRTMTMANTNDKQALRHHNIVGDEGDESRRQRLLTASSPSSSSSSQPSSSSSLKCHPIPMTVPTSSNAVNPYGSRYSSRIVIAHRGASAHLPEHSVAAYRLALELGADYIEPDLVATSDEHLVAMHSLDLAETTNVEDVFPSSRKTTSRYMNDREGYWIYTFTLEEVKTLRLKQRLAEQGGRTKVYDGLFEVPTLTEILELIVEWNSSIQPRRYNSNATLVPITSPETDSSNNNIHYERRPPPPSGRLYAELKDFSWLLEDANINLIDLLFDHMRTATSSSSTSTSSLLLWDEALFKYMCNTKVVSTDYSYKLPPLFIQSFEPSVLENFTQRWEEYSKSTATVTATNSTSDDQSQQQSSSSSPSSSLFTHQVSTTTESHDGDVVNLPLPVPPTILLVPHDKCHDFDHFWYDIQSTYRRDSIKGIGPDKKCFFSTMMKDGGVGGSGDEPIQALQRDIMDLAVKQDWVVHPYTERPETSFIASPSSEMSPSSSESSSPPYFANVLEELMYLKCVVGVHGVFSESVDVAVRAMNLPCPGGYDLISVDESNVDIVSHQTSVESGTSFPSSSNSGSSSSSTSCPTPSSSQNNISTVFNGEEVPLGPVVLLSFTMGMVGSLFMYCFWRRIMLCRRRQRGGVGDGITSTEHSSVSTNGTGKNLAANSGRTGKIIAPRLRGTVQHDHSVLPTSDEVDDDNCGDLELTDADREML